MKHKKGNSERAHSSGRNHAPLINQSYRSKIAIDHDLYDRPWKNDQFFVDQSDQSCIFFVFELRIPSAKYRDHIVISQI